MRSIVIFLLTICFITTVYADVGYRHYEKEGGFSLSAPMGWEFRDFPGMKFKIAFGEPGDSFCPNINIVDEAFSGSLKAYVNENIKAMSRMFQKFKKISRKPFVTNSGLNGELLVINALQQGNLLRQTFLLIKGKKGKYLVVTCSCLEKNGERFTKVFEESLKTFELIN